MEPAPRDPAGQARYLINQTTFSSSDVHFSTGISQESTSNLVSPAGILDIHHLIIISSSITHLFSLGFSNTPILLGSKDNRATGGWKQKSHHRWDE